MKHVMIDLETMGTKPDCKIISVGAVFFDINGIGETFYRRVNWHQPGRSMCDSTVQWWMTQSDEAVAEVLEPASHTLEYVLAALRAWIGFDIIVWGNGSLFDIAILNHAYDYNPPWSYSNARDLRTMRALSKVKFDGKVEVAHHALHDAKYQAEWLIHIYKELGFDEIC